jgi:hypothetical protein
LRVSQKLLDNIAMLDSGCPTQLGKLNFKCWAHTGRYIVMYKFLLLIDFLICYYLNLSLLLILASVEIPTYSDTLNQQCRITSFNYFISSTIALTNLAKWMKISLLLRKCRVHLRTIHTYVCFKIILLFYMLLVYSVPIFTKIFWFL